MAFRRRLIFFVAFGLGVVGCIACTAAILGLWSASSRLRQTTETVFGKVDASLVAIQERARRTRDRVEASAITTENITTSLKEWTAQEARERIALQFDVAEKSDRLRLAMLQADDWLELSASSAESVQDALSLARELGAQIDPGTIDGIIEQIASLRSQLSEATDFVEKLHERTAAMGEEESLETRIPQAVQLALRVTATLGSINSRIEKFENRLGETQKNVRAMKISTIRWIRLVAILIAMLVVWMGAGQVALCYVAWSSLRRPPK